jgi:hypothetical protein
MTRRKAQANLETAGIAINENVRRQDLCMADLFTQTVVVVFRRTADGHVLTDAAPNLDALDLFTTAMVTPYRKLRGRS